MTILVVDPRPMIVNTIKAIVVVMIRFLYSEFILRAR